MVYISLYSAYRSSSSVLALVPIALAAPVAGCCSNCNKCDAI